MARGFIVGSTDYSNQSLQDILLDLNQWVKYLSDSKTIFKSVISELEKESYWSSVDYAFKASCYDLITYFNTAIADLDEVIKGIDSEIKEFHIKLLENLGSTAHEQYEHHRSAWKGYGYKDYGEDNFKKLEELYAVGCDMTGDMFDLNNLAPRLEQFVGKSKVDITKPTTQVNNNFNAPITGLQQNFDSITVQQAVNTDPLIKKDFNSPNNFASRHPIFIGTIISLLVGFLLLFSFWGEVITWIEGLFT